MVEDMEKDIFCPWEPSDNEISEYCYTVDPELHLLCSKVGQDVNTHVAGSNVTSSSLSSLSNPAIFTLVIAVQHSQ
jgi:hypothetical protein